MRAEFEFTQHENLRILRDCHSEGCREFNKGVSGPINHYAGTRDFSVVCDGYNFIFVAQPCHHRLWGHGAKLRLEYIFGHTFISPDESVHIGMQYAQVDSRYGISKKYWTSLDKAILKIFNVRHGLGCLISIRDLLKIIRNSGFHRFKRRQRCGVCLKYLTRSPDDRRSLCDLTFNHHKNRMCPSCNGRYRNILQLKYDLRQQEAELERAGNLTTRTRLLLDYERTRVRLLALQQSQENTLGRLRIGRSVKQTTF